MDYKSIKNDEEPVKRPLDAVSLKITPEGKPIVRKRKNSAFCVIVFTLFAFALLFCTTFIYRLAFQSDYESIHAFDNVKVKVDLTKLRPAVELKFKSKGFSMYHHFGSEQKTEPSHDHGFFSGLLKRHSLSHEKRGKVFSLKREHDIEVRIKKVSNETDSHKHEHEHEHQHVKDNSVECFQIDISSLGRLHETDETVACFNLTPNYWYGGHESWGEPFWPINNQSFDYKAYITGYPDGWAGVLERYWLSSNGIAIFLNENIPLHVKHLDPNQICLMSDRTLAPYKYTPAVYSDNSLSYQLCSGPDPKTTHTYMINNYIGKPKNYPDPKMITTPVWTTWAYYFTNINQETVLNYAQQIVDHGYPRSNLEIDDKWEGNYGDLDFYTKSFPDMKTLSTQLHNLGFRVTLWVHPFCNIDSKCFIEGADKGYWVKATGSDLPGLTTWWNGRYAALLDTTNPNATAYFVGKLNTIKQDYLVDAFKFDAGESSWTPQAFKLFDPNVNPNVYSANYVRAAASMGNFIEVRVGARTQDVGIFYRILDRASDWTIHDGIKSVITETLQFGILGYPYVLPDIIYGNGGPDSSKKELFIRWTQMNTFLPSMQFSVPPWYFDNETDTICKELVLFRVSALSDYLLKLASQLDGIPMVRPMWWGNNTDASTFTMNDQFMLGDEIVVAPILDEGARARDIYLPGGTWFNPSNNSTIAGPTWLRNYPVPLDNIPFFLAENGSVRNSQYFK